MGNDRILIPAAAGPYGQKFFIKMELVCTGHTIGYTLPAQRFVKTFLRHLLQRIH